MIFICLLTILSFQVNSNNTFAIFSKCRLCGDRDKTINHKIRECKLNIGLEMPGWGFDP